MACIMPVRVKLEALHVHPHQWKGVNCCVSAAVQALQCPGETLYKDSDWTPEIDVDITPTIDVVYHDPNEIAQSWYFIISVVLDDRKAQGLIL